MMAMVRNCSPLTFLIGVSLWLLLSCSLSGGTATDIHCLQRIKDSLEDTYNYLSSSWDFSNNTEGAICQFVGIECWHLNESRVLNIRLADMGLKGEFPRGVMNCSSLTGLDLSGNKLSGNIPQDMPKILESVTSLDLSSNNLLGELPASLANCYYLNVLKLDYNGFTGQIPAEFNLLSRIKQFSVANNLLSGPIPQFRNVTIPASNYANNLGLCGAPLDPCKPALKKSHTAIIVAAAVGGVTVSALGVSVGMFFLRKVSVKKKEDDPEGNKWAKGLKGTKGIKAS